MALQKQNQNIPFRLGLDTKTDEKQISFGKFLSLSNSVFDTTGLLRKRNGFPQVTVLPNNDATSITTFNGNLLAVGNEVQAFSQESNQWIDAGNIQPLELSVLPMVRSSSSQTTVDVAVNANGLSCVTWLDSNGNSYYQIVDSLTGQIIVPFKQLVATATMPRVYNLGNYFIVTYLATISAATHLQYIAIPIANPASPFAAVDISTQASGLTAAYDGYVANNSLYLAFNGSDGGGAIRVTYLDSSLNLHATAIHVGVSANLISVTADIMGSTPVIWVSYYNSGSSSVFTSSYTGQLVPILINTLTDNPVTLNELTSSAQDGLLTLFEEVANTYTFAPNEKTDYIRKNTVTAAGVVGSPSIILRSVGLASKSFIYQGKIYVLATYGQTFQPTYFLIDSDGNIIAKLAYSNGGGYAANQILANVNIQGSDILIGYLFKDLLQSINKTQGAAGNIDGIYSQTGINLAKFSFVNFSNTQEIGNNLNITGGFLWAYDGVKPTEQGFNVWPEGSQTTVIASGGSMSIQQYFYQITYEWTDAQGNLFRSAPSIGEEATVTVANSSVTLNIPTLRLTYKVSPNPVRIVIYRWSAAQQNYYQITSISSPLLNNPAVDSVSFLDTFSDAQILGNVLLYTTGDVIENIAPPAFVDIALFKSRLLGISSEDRNLLWYSKQVIESTPVEMSDLFTIFVAPTTGAQGSTGDMTCLSAMDDKAIIFKKNAIYYFTGNGPDNTGANNDFSEPVFITSTVGCTNKRSIVFMPQGLMFQSDKGIWLLGRDLSTQYIGAAVEKYNSNVVLSSINIPGTNQVRFELDNGITLMYDYYQQQWGEFSGIPAVSSTLYQGLHTYLDKYGRIFQEKPNTYLDGSSPVLMSFKTGWFNFTGLQGYQRAYFFYLLGEFFSPHKLQIQIAYDYSPVSAQSVMIAPYNYNAPWGGDELYGESTPWGGSPSLEQWRVFFEQQKCQAFQISLNEIFDSSYGIVAGRGLTISGLNLVYGMKKGYVPIMAKQSVG